MTKKTYVLDTNVLLEFPNALHSFGDNNVCIPSIVIEELDSFKTDRGDKGFCSRNVIRYLDSLKEQGNITAGVKNNSGGYIKVIIDSASIVLPSDWDISKPDNKILQTCIYIKRQNSSVCLVTNDMILGIKATTLGVESKKFKSGSLEIDTQYTGRRELYTSSRVIDLFFSKQEISINNVALVNEDGTIFDKDLLIENEFIVMKSTDALKHSAIAIFQENKLKQLRYINYKPYGITPRNAGQKMLVESLMRDVSEAPLVIAKGPAGTAKTLLSLAVGLEKVYTANSDKEYRKILICRPNIHMDEDIGFLPGNEQEKIAPLMRPIYDNLEVLIDSSPHRYSNEGELRGKIEYLFEKEIITTEAVAFLRGRSIVRQWLIIDEAQNLTQKQVKAIITRAGEGTKVILVGDPDQIDSKNMDSRNNGLSYASEQMKGSKMCYQVTFTPDECVRSSLATEAAKRL